MATLRLRDAEWKQAWKRRLVDLMVVGVLIQQLVPQNGKHRQSLCSRGRANAGNVIQEVPVVEWGLACFGHD
jgi:hypothetical protein